MGGDGGLSGVPRRSDQRSQDRMAQQEDGRLQGIMPAPAPAIWRSASLEYSYLCAI